MILETNLKNKKLYSGIYNIYTQFSTKKLNLKQKNK